MKRFVFVTTSVFIIATSFSCNNSSSSSISTGYTDPVFTTSKTQAVKNYSVGTYSCSSSKSCGAVIFLGTLNSETYAGIAAGKDSTNQNFNLKIYWLSGSLDTPEVLSPASGDLTTGTYKILINDGTNIYNTTTDSLDITITEGQDAILLTVYTITFNSAISVSDGNGHSFTINSNDTIAAYKWPE